MKQTQGAGVEQSFEEQHEEKARQGWPATWADLPVFDMVWQSWPREYQQALLSEGLDAQNEYFVSVAHRYTEYLRQTKTGGTETMKKRAWKVFLEDTAGDRRGFRSRVLSKYLQLLSQLS